MVTYIEHFDEIERYIAIEFDNRTILRLMILSSLDELEYLVDDFIFDGELPLFQDLHRFFRSEKIDFSRYRIDMSGYSPFVKEVLETVSKIPFGRTLSYSDVAELIGKPRACRAVGNAVGSNRTAIVIPCHRVVGKNNLGGFGDLGLDLKSKLLEVEKGD